MQQRQAAVKHLASFNRPATADHQPHRRGPFLNRHRPDCNIIIILFLQICSVLCYSFPNGGFNITTSFVPKIVDPCSQDPSTSHMLCHQLQVSAPPPHFSSVFVTTDSAAPTVDVSITARDDCRRICVRNNVPAISQCTKAGSSVSTHSVDFIHTQWHS